MPPADCTAIAPEPIQVGEPPKPAGWPEVVSNSRPTIGSIPESGRAAYAEHIRQKRLAARPAWPPVSYSPLALAVRAADAAYDALVEPDIAHSIAEQFADEDRAEREEIYEEADGRLQEAVQHILNVPAPSAAVALEKVTAFFVGQGSPPASNGGFSGNLLLKEDLEIAFHSLWRDMQALSVNSDANCPAARLLDQQEALYEAESEENETGVMGPAHRRYREIEEQASWARARSLRGAMYQIALAVGRVDLMSNEEDEVQVDLDGAYVQRLLVSTMAVLHTMVGGAIPDVINSYSGYNYSCVDRLSDDPQPFDARAFVKQYTAAGGRLVMGYGEEGDDALTNTYPRDPGIRAAFIKELSDPTKHEALLELMKAERRSRVNAENPRGDAVTVAT